MNVIIKSGKKNWSGKEFSDYPAKIYTSFDDAVSALNSYHFFTFDDEKCEYIPCEKKQKIEIIHLTESKERMLLSSGKIRW
jgi:hypothetical protein